MLGTGPLRLRFFAKWRQYRQRAVETLPNAYNTALAEVDKNRGQNGGALTGDGSIFSLTEAE